MTYQFSMKMGSVSLALYFASGSNAIGTNLVIICISKNILSLKNFVPVLHCEIIIIKILFHLLSIYLLECLKASTLIHLSYLVPSQPTDLTRSLASSTVFSSGKFFLSIDFCHCVHLKQTPERLFSLVVKPVDIGTKLYRTSGCRHFRQSGFPPLFANIIPSKCDST